MNILKEFVKEEDGVGVVEIILILVVLIALIVLFKSQIQAIVDSAFKSIKNNSSTIIDGKK